MDPSVTPPMPRPLPRVTLQEVTAQSVRSITKLKVAHEQLPYVASNAESIAQAYFHPEAWFRAICVDDTPVGFVMLEDPTLLPDWLGLAQVGLWRFMIDRQHQRRGVGRAALRLVADHVRSRPGGQTTLRTSCVSGPHSPIAFYEKFGFRRTGEFDDGEAILELRLR